MLESFIVALNVAVYACFAVAIVAFPFLLVNSVRAANSMPRLASPGMRASRMPLKSMLFFATPIAISFLLTWVITTHARSDTLRFLKTLPPSYALLVNGHQVDSPRAILSALKEIDGTMAHHSHPTTRIRVEVRSSSEDLRLVLGRDSQNASEYWVYYPKYKVTTSNDIGRVFTDALRAY